MRLDQIILEDRSTGTKYALSVNDRILRWTTSTETAFDEPIVEDKLSPGVYRRLFLIDGILACETVTTVQDDKVDLIDPVSGYNFRLAVYGFVPGIYPADSWFDSLSFIPASSWSEVAQASDSWQQQNAGSDSWREKY